MIKILYLFLAFVIDIFIGIFIPTSFVGFNISATPNLLLITLILITYKDDILKSLLLAFIVGFSLDLFNYDTFFAYAIIYMLTTWAVSAWLTRINDTFIEVFLVTLSAVFLKEFLVYLYNVTFNGFILQIGSWAAMHLFFTILLAIVPIIIITLLKLKSIDKNSRKIQIGKKW